MTNFFNFSNNPGYLLVKLTDKQLSPIWTEVKKIQSGWEGEKFNHELAGNIKREFKLVECLNPTAEMVGPYVGEYLKHFKYASPYEVLSKELPLSIFSNDLWVNFQQKHEFNPIHNHRGVISFVIWLQIPFYFKDEAPVGPGVDSQSPLCGDFSFHWINSLGQIKNENLLVDKSKEGYLCIFPSETMHSVYPFFSSNEYRITVAGNWRFDTEPRS